MEELEYVDLIKVNIPSKSFLIIGSNGSIQEIKCKSSSQFIKHLNFIKENINKDEIRYEDLD
tara:strand:+ start:438 stop:623 length:186 start_codon:yes stop_codon:yes gene_type:complete